MREGRGTVQATLITILFTTTMGTKGDAIEIQSSSKQPKRVQRIWEEEEKKPKAMRKDVLAIRFSGGGVFSQTNQ